MNKESATDELLTAIHKLLPEKKYISAAVAEQLADNMGEKQLFKLLSDRKMQVFHLFASAKTVNEVEEEISLSVKTISTCPNQNP